MRQNHHALKVFVFRRKCHLKRPLSTLLDDNLYGMLILSSHLIIDIGPQMMGKF